MRKRHSTLLGVAVLGLGISLFYLFTGQTAATAGINPELSFEGKVVTATGINIPDGTYNMEFKIYAGGTNTGGGTLDWTEDYLVGSAEPSPGVAFVSGTFDVNLGSNTAFASLVNWNTYPLYLSIQIGNTSSCTITTNFTANCGGDTEMKPYILLTSTPYSFNSSELGGLTAASYAQLSANQTFTGTNTFQTSTNSTTAFQVQNASGSNLINANTTSSNVSFDQLSAPGTVTATLAPAAPTSIVVTGSTASSTTYTYEVLGVDANGAVTYSSPTTTKNTLDATALTATNYNTVNWTSTGASEYLIYRTVSGGTGTSATTGLIGTSTTNSFADIGYTASQSIPVSTAAGLSAGTTYYYKVTALDSIGGQTTASGEVSKAASAATNDAITLSWAPVTGARAYDVYYEVGGSGGTEANYFTVYTNSFTMTTTTGNTAGSPPTVNNAYDSTLATYGTSQITIGNTTGSASTAQLDVAGNIPSAATSSVGTGTAPSSVYVAGHYAYVVNQTGNTLQVIDISNQVKPTIIGSVTTSSAPKSVYVSGRYAYVADSGSATLQVVDVNNPAAPVVVGSVITGTGPTSVFVAGHYAYVVSTSSNELQVIDISNPAVPVVVASIGAGAIPISVYVQGHYAYIVGETSSSLMIFDVSNPINPVLDSTLTTGSNPSSVYVSGRYAYVANSGSSTIQIVDVSNVFTPVITSTTTANVNPDSIYVAGHYAYVVMGNPANTVQVLDVSNANAPTLVGTFPVNMTPTSVFVSGRYAYVTSSGASTLQIFDMGGAFIQNLQAGSTETGTLLVDTNSSIGGDESVGGGLTIGNGAYITGTLEVSGATLLEDATTFEGGILGGASISSLSVPSAPVITYSGAIGTATTYDYAVSAVSPTGFTLNSPNGPITTNDTTFANMNSTHFNIVTWTPVAGAISYNIYRTVGGTSQGLIGNTAGDVFDDTGIGSSASSPTIDTSGQLFVSGRVGIENTNPTADLDVGPGTLGTSQIVQIRVGDFILQSQQGAANGITASTSRGSNGNLTIDGASGDALLLSAFTTNNDYLAAGGGNVGIGFSIGTAPSGNLSFANDAPQLINVLSSSTASGTNLTIAAGNATGAAHNGGNLILNGGSSGSATAGSVTVDTVGAGTVSFGNSDATTIDIGSTSGSTTTIGGGDVNHTIDIGGAGTTSVQTILIGSDGSSTSSVMIGGGNLTTANGGAGVVIGDGYSASATGLDALTLDSDNVFTETTNTCTATVNGGAMYYNSTTNTIRACVNGGWEDLVSTSGLGLLAYGVIPDSGTGAGDLGSVTSAGVSGPCKVSWHTATTVEIVQGCLAYSGGRKVIIPDGTVPTGTLTFTNGDFVHVCLTGTNDQPAFSAKGTESADMPTFSANNPVVCLADIKTSGTAITQIYDVRTFTTTRKTFATLNATTGILGGIVSQTTTANVVQLANVATQLIMGVIVATAGSTASNNTVNMIIADGGPQYVKASTTAQTAGVSVIETTTAGYSGSGTASTTAYATLGISHLATTNTCAAAATCLDSQFTDIDIR